MDVWVHVCARTCAGTLRGAEGVIPLLIHLFPLLERSINPRTASGTRSTLHRILNANKHTLFFFVLNEGRPYCIITFNAALISTITGCFFFFLPRSLCFREREALISLLIDGFLRSFFFKHAGDPSRLFVKVIFFLCSTR